MKSMLALASLALACTLVGCGESGGVPAAQKVQPRPVDPANQVTAPDAKFKGSFQQDATQGGKPE
jgi:predicted small lipoprotein YifL